MLQCINFDVCNFNLAIFSCQCLNAKDSDDPHDIVASSLAYRSSVCRLLSVLQSETSEGEMAAFCAFAIAFPTSFVALVDTYDVMKCVC